MTPDEMIAVIRAHQNGKTIESRSSHTGNEWREVEPMWNFHTSEYRVKPDDTSIAELEAERLELGREIDELRCALDLARAESKRLRGRLSQSTEIIESVRLNIVDMRHIQAGWLMKIAAFNKTKEEEGE